MEQIVEKLSRFNRIYGTIIHPSGTIFNELHQWYDASPFILGLRLSNVTWYPPQPQQDYFLYIIFGNLLPKSQDSFEITIKKEISFSYYYSNYGISFSGIDSTFPYTPYPATVEDLFSFLDAIPNNWALCINILWAKPLIELACKNN